MPALRAEHDVSRRRHPSDDLLDDTADRRVLEDVVELGDDLGRRVQGEVPRLARVTDA